MFTPSTVNASQSEASPESNEQDEGSKEESKQRSPEPTITFIEIDDIVEDPTAIKHHSTGTRRRIIDLDLPEESECQSVSERADETGIDSLKQMKLNSSPKQSKDKMVDIMKAKQIMGIKQQPLAKPTK